MLSNDFTTTPEYAQEYFDAQEFYGNEEVPGDSDDISDAPEDFSKSLDIIENSMLKIMEIIQLQIDEIIRLRQEIDALTGGQEETY